MGKGIGILTKRQAEVLRLELFGFSQDEISKRLNISQPRVSAILKTAKKKVEQAKRTIDFYEETAYLGSLREAGYKGEVILKKGYHY